MSRTDAKHIDFSNASDNRRMSLICLSRVLRARSARMLAARLQRDESSAICRRSQEPAHVIWLTVKHDICMLIRRLFALQFVLEPL